VLHAGARVMLQGGDGVCTVGNPGNPGNPGLPNGAYVFTWLRPYAVHIQGPAAAGDVLMKQVGEEMCEEIATAASSCLHVGTQPGSLTRPLLAAAGLSGECTQCDPWGSF
jgi:hypothetical protein